MKGPKRPRAVAESPAEIVKTALTSDVPRLIPCGGTHVRYFDPISHRSHHVHCRNLDEVEELRRACELGLAPRIRKELEEFVVRYPRGLYTECIVELEAAGIL